MTDTHKLAPARPGDIVAAPKPCADCVKKAAAQDSKGKAAAWRP
jgi:hypothetical protein